MLVARSHLRDDTSVCSRSTTCPCYELIVLMLRMTNRSGWRVRVLEVATHDSHTCMYKNANTSYVGEPAVVESNKCKFCRAPWNLWCLINWRRILIKIAAGTLASIVISVWTRLSTVVVSGCLQMLFQGPVSMLLVIVMVFTCRADMTSWLHLTRYPVT